MNIYFPIVIIRPECRKDAAKQAEEWGNQLYKVLPDADELAHTVNIVASQIQLMLDFNASQDPKTDITAKIRLPVGCIKFILQNPVDDQVAH